MKHLTLIVLLIFTALRGAAFGITGEVTDSVGEPEAYATIRIYNASDTVKPVRLGTTDINGLFDMAVPSAGSYRLNITSVGKQPVNVPFTVTAAAPVAAAGRIVACDAMSRLGEVTVTALRPVVTREIDRIGYDVQADDDAKTLQLDEMLKRVPLVSVDPDGTIYVKGSSSFKVYKNGRPNNSMSRNAKEIFKSIPASMIKKIEVITDPGAREDAEGSSAILNIVTVENTVTTGLMGTVGLNWMQHSNSPAPNIWLTGTVDKVNVSAYGGYNTWSDRAHRQSTQQRRIYSDTGDVLDYSYRSQGHGRSGWAGMEASYEPDSLNLFNAEFNAWTYSMKSVSDALADMHTASGVPVYTYRNLSLTDPTSYFSLDGSANYQHSTRLKGETLTLSYQISTTNQKTDRTDTYSDMVSMPVPYTGVISDSRLLFMEHTVQGDWSRPWGDRHKTDVGFKYINRSNHSRTTNEYVDFRTLRTDFIHRTQVAAAYADYRLQAGPAGLRAGLRYEFSRLSARYKDGSEAPFGSNLNDLVPNAAVNYNINDRNTVKLGYSTSISRPGIDYLNPAVNSSPASVSYGNPGLNSAFTQSFDLNYSYLGTKINLDFNAGYTFSNNGIITSQWDEDNILFTTYANGGRTRRFNASLFTRWSMTAKTTLTLNGQVTYDYQRNPSLGISEGWWGGYGSMRATQKLPWKVDLNGYAMVWLGGSGLYQRMEQRFCDAVRYGISLSRNFLKEGRLSTRIGIMNPFGPSRRRMKVTNINGMQGESTTYTFKQSNLVNIGISYRFGSVNTMVKKVAKTISNTDLTGQPSAKSSSAAE